MGDNIHMSLNFTDEAEQTKIFEHLSTGGKITMPLGDTFWGARFGMLTDQFGIHWMFNCNKTHDWSILQNPFNSMCWAASNEGYRSTRAACITRFSFPTCGNPVIHWSPLDGRVRNAFFIQIHTMHWHISQYQSGARDSTLMPCGTTKSNLMILLTAPLSWNVLLTCTMPLNFTKLWITQRHMRYSMLTLI